MGELLRRRAMIAAGGEPTEQGLLQQGSLTFNGATVSSSGRTVSFGTSGITFNDAYNVKRYWNLTNFTENITTGTGNTGNISAKNSGKTIPAGSTCIFSVSNVVVNNPYSANYAYTAILLRDTASNNLARIGFAGNNKPAASASFTVSSDTEIGCIALESSHMAGAANRKHTGDLSFTVNGEEWL